VLKHYRPFGYFRSLSLRNRVRGVLAFLVINSWAIPIVVGVAHAQSAPLTAASVTIDEANRRAADAWDKKDYATALIWLRQSADQGDPKGQLYIGHSFFSGLGVPQNYSEAMTWYRKAADQGNASAMSGIGKLYYGGRGVPRDYAEAMVWFRKAAEKGDLDAENAIGLMYKRGLGVRRDDAQALTWWLKSAEQGDAQTQSTVGYMYLMGEGTPTDHARAMSWFQKSAAQGVAEAQAGIGLLYRFGSGVPEDHEQARKWFKKAIAQNDEKAKKELAEMDAEDRNPGFKHPERIPPMLHTVCFLQNPQMLKATKLDKAEQETVALKYKACLRSEWKRVSKGAPFPAD
jgi:TPR repeat protein